MKREGKKRIAACIDVIDTCRCLDRDICLLCVILNREKQEILKDEMNISDRIFKNK